MFLRVVFRTLRLMALFSILYSGFQAVEALTMPFHVVTRPISTGPQTMATQECGAPIANKHEDSLAMLMLLCIEFIAFLLHYVLHETKFKWLQEAGASLLLGALVGLIIRYLVSIQRLEYYITFEPEFFYLVLLPPIIFESGYNMRRRKFFDNIGSVLLLAFLGTFIATFVTGLLIYAFASANIFYTPLTLLESLLFGALISATDPVTVLAIFKALRVDLDLYSNIFGESVLNDAVAIVLFKTIFAFVDKPLNAFTVIAGIGQFILVFGGSTLIGIAVALVSALMFKFAKFHKSATMELAILTMFAYASYLLAEGCQLSGIVAILFCGITMAHYTFNNLSPPCRTLSVDFFQLAATLSDTLIFLFLGMALFAFEGKYDPILIIISILVILFARAVHVFPISLFTNLFRKAEKKIKPSYQFFIWFAGLRGAIAFTLSIELRDIEPLVTSRLGVGANEIFSTTLMITFFSVLILGGLTIPVLEKLKIPMGVEPDPQASTENKNAFYRVDKTYLKPFFTRGKFEYERQDDHQAIELQPAESSTSSSSNPPPPSSDSKPTPSSQKKEDQLHQVHLDD